MADKPDGKVRWVKKDAFVMPVLPKSLRVDPVVAGFLHMMAFLELSGDDTVDPDGAVEAMEHVGFYLDRFPPDRKAVFGEQVGRVTAYARKKRWGKAAVEFFSEFMDNYLHPAEAGPSQAVPVPALAVSFCSVNVKGGCASKVCDW